ncbi:MAG: hypothetical protein K6V36_09585 [Anaerolineae bacterium]|nr:hypothetical protein [Anaerolineae bacterium]
MFDPVYIISAEQRYEDLLREAEAERLARSAGPARAMRPVLGLAGILLALALMAS